MVFFYFLHAGIVQWHAHTGVFCVLGLNDKLSFIAACPSRPPPRYCTFWLSDYWWPQHCLFYTLLLSSCRTISAESAAMTRTGVRLTYQVKLNRSLRFAIYEPWSDYWWPPSEFMLLRSHRMLCDSFWKEQYFQVWHSAQFCIAVLNMCTKNCYRSKGIRLRSRVRLLMVSEDWCNTYTCPGPTKSRNGETRNGKLEMGNKSESVWLARPCKHALWMQCS